MDLVFRRICGFQKCFVFLLIPFAVFIVSCQTKRASLPPRPDVSFQQGKTIVKGKDSDIALFVGNQRSLPMRSEGFSRLAAIEHCQATSLIPILLSTVDYSQEQTYSETVSSTQPVTSYSVQKGEVVRSQQLVTNVTSYPVRLVTPRFATYFICVKTLAQFSGHVPLEKLSRDLVSPITHDFKGGYLVGKDSQEKAFREGDVIVSIAGKRIETLTELIDALAIGIRPKKTTGTVSVKLIRNKKEKTVSVKVVDLSTQGLGNMFAETEKSCRWKNKDEAPIASCDRVAGLREAILKLIGPGAKTKPAAQPPAKAPVPEADPKDKSFKKMEPAV